MRAAAGDRVAREVEVVLGAQLQSVCAGRALGRVVMLVMRERATSGGRAARARGGDLVLAAQPRRAGAGQALARGSCW